jgi:hypothetical protein
VDVQPNLIYTGCLKEFMDCACKLFLKPHDGPLMTGHGLLDHLDPVAVFRSVLICFFVK